MRTEQAATPSHEQNSSLQLSAGRMKILRAVTELLEEGASQKITINRIAKKNAVTEAALYRHYRSKEDIFSDLFGYIESHFIVPLDSAQRDVNIALERRLENIFNAYATFLEGHPGLARLLVGQSNTEVIGLSEKVALLHAKIRAQLSLMVKRALAEGTLQLGHSPDEVADLFYSAVMSAALATTFSLTQLPTQQRFETLRKAIFSIRHKTI